VPIWAAAGNTIIIEARLLYRDMDQPDLFVTTFGARSSAPTGGAVFAGEFG